MCLMHIMCIMHIMLKYYRFGLGLMFEWQILENFVNQMYEILVQHELLPHDESLGRVAKKKKSIQSRSC